MIVRWRLPFSARPSSASLAKGPYASAVSKKVTPRSRARWIVASDSRSSRSAAVPYDWLMPMQPRPRAETARPWEPSERVGSMVPECKPMHVARALDHMVGHTSLRESPEGKLPMLLGISRMVFLRGGSYRASQSREVDRAYVFLVHVLRPHVDRAYLARRM